MKAVEYTIAGLKCDAEGCDFTDETVSYADYEQWLNKPCPKCGANLLTPADFAACKAIEAAAGWINAMVPGDFPADSPKDVARIDMDGSGVPSVVIVSREQPQ